MLTLGHCTGSVCRKPLALTVPVNQVFITADSAAAYRDLRQRLKHVRDAAITTTDNEQLLQTCVLVG